MIEKNLKRYTYGPGTILRQAMGDLYQKEISICLVVDKGDVLRGVLTIGDLKQALMQGLSPYTALEQVMNKDFTTAPIGTSEAKLRKLANTKTRFGTGVIEKVPLVDKAGRLKALYTLGESRKPKTILVTGGAGYVGSHVCRMLLARGYSVVVLDALMFGDKGVRELYKHKNFKLIKGNISDIGTVVQAVQGVDAVIHLAGIVGDPAAALNPLQTMEINHFATKALIDVCKHYQVERFVFASSCSVYGASPGILNEKSKLYPVSLYAQSKCYSEQELLSHTGSDFRPVMLRFGTLYGLSPRMRFDLVANTMSAHAHYNKKIKVDGGAQWRPLLHVEDAASACVAALEAPQKKVVGQVFNVGDTKENYRIREIADYVHKHHPASHIESLDTVKDRRDYKVSFTKINSRMGWRAKRSLSEGLKEIAHALRQGSFKKWQGPEHSNYLTQRALQEE